MSQLKFTLSNLIGFLLFIIGVGLVSVPLSEWMVSTFNVGPVWVLGVVLIGIAIYFLVNQ